MDHEIKVSKLVSGELVIGEYAPDAKDYYIRNPMHIVFGPGQNDQQVGVSLIPYTPFMAKDSMIKINEDKILCWIDIYPIELKKKYQSQISGLTIL